MSQLSRPKYEVADVVNLFGDEFRKNHTPLGQHLRVLNAIAKCRTAALGGHLDVCNACGHQRMAYNSCRNRHCPKCQGTNRERWILARQDDLLPTSYFHVVFTLPELLNIWCLNYPEQLYNMLFKASSYCVETLAADPKHLGAKMGMVAVLHTWGQQLWLHPHVHCILPGGGITKAGHWKPCRSKGKYLFPGKVMGAVFRGKFMELFKAFCRTENITLDSNFVNSIYAKPWVVYAKQPFMGPKQVIEYLGRYTHRVAISNHRIKSVADGKVAFSFKDYRNGGQQKTMAIEGCEFLRRFCLHVLPRGFRKIRHYGILASRAKPKLKMQQMKMGIAIVKNAKPSWQQIVNQTMGFDVDACPCCKSGKMITILCFQANAPPALLSRITKPALT